MASASRAVTLAKEINAAFGAGTVKMGSDPYFEVTYLPTGVSPVDDLLEGGLPFGRFVEIFGDYCVTPDTKILTDALSWAPAGEILPDYGLVGFDEELNQGRGRTATLKPSQVEHLGYKKLHCIRVVTDRGEITCSRGHGFVARNRLTGSREWRKASDLLVGDELAWTTEPWELLTSRDAGYAAGILDGEGWVDGKRVNFGQVPGLVLDEGIAALKRLGFETTVTLQENGVYRVSVTGGMYETMRALGQLRPVRLLHQAVPIWSGRGMVSKGPFTQPGKTVARVLAVEEVGKQDVVTMQTSSRTFIANGFPSHNSTLKSYIGLCAIRECQRLGKLAGLIDTEHAFDPKWAKEIGVDVDELVLKQPDTAEQAIDIAEVMIRGGVDLIVFDSVAAALPQQEQQKKMDKENPAVAALARVMSLAMRKLTAANKKTAMLWINQTRVNVGVMFGSNEAVPGGKSLPFYACLGPNTLILRADYKWVPVSTLREGDELVAFDEEVQPGTHGRKFRRARVIGNKKILKPSFQVVTDQGTQTIASSEHLWLVQGGSPSKPKNVWKRTDELEAGDKIRWFGKPWDSDYRYDAAYLSGIFDGEGTVNLSMRTRSENNRGFTISMCQLPGEVLDKTKMSLDNLGFKYRENVDLGNGTVRLTLLGSLHERMRFLGQVAPIRLVNKVSAGWEGAAMFQRGRFADAEFATVVSCKAVGKYPVYAIGTSTETLIADGMMSHNSYRIAFRKAGRVTEDVEVYVSKNGKPTKAKIKLTVAQTIRATKEKSKLNAPHREVMFDFDFRAGKVNDWGYLAYKCLDEGLLTVDKGRWWITGDPSTKYRGIEALRMAMTEDELRNLLGGPMTKLKSPGNSVAVKKKVVKRRSASSRNGERKSTRIQGRAASKKTVVIRKRSTK